MLKILEMANISEDDADIIDINQLGFFHLCYNIDKEQQVNILLPNGILRLHLYIDIVLLEVNSKMALLFFFSF